MDATVWGVSKRKRRGRVSTTIGAFLLVLILVLGTIWYLTKEPSPHKPPLPSVPTTTPTIIQGAGCADVELVSIPGTWESKVGDDPHRPTANPRSLLLSVTRPLDKKFDAARLKSWTVSYPAQFKNPQRLAEMSYDDSRTAGEKATREALHRVAAHCPLTNFLLVGFSQGAVIGGNIANEIGRGRGPIPANRVLGVALIADGRREAGAGIHIGNHVEGKGLEIVLQGTPIELAASTFGATMTGARDGGFGAIDNKVFDLCAPGDLICDSSLHVADIFSVVGGNAKHSQYQINREVVNGQTAVSWIIDKFSELVSDAPHFPTP